MSQLAEQMRTLGWRVHKDDGDSVVVSMPSKSELRKHERECWERMDPVLRARAVEILRREIPHDVKDQVRKAVAADPDWLVGQHFFWGMAIRNVLRVPSEGEGIKDVATPTGNWDDCYVPALEEALELATD